MQSALDLMQLDQSLRRLVRPVLTMLAFPVLGQYGADVATAEEVEEAIGMLRNMDDNTIRKEAKILSSCAEPPALSLSDLPQIGNDNPFASLLGGMGGPGQTDPFANMFGSLGGGGALGPGGIPGFGGAGAGNPFGAAAGAGPFGGANPFGGAGVPGASGDPLANLFGGNSQVSSAHLSASFPRPPFPFPPRLFISRAGKGSLLQSRSPRAVGGSFVAHSHGCRLSDCTIGGVRFLP